MDLSQSVHTKKVLYQDRSEAGRKLAQELKGFVFSNPVVVGLSRGGMPVAWEVSRSMNAKLEVMVVKKLSVPENPEFGFGAIAENETIVFDSNLVEALQITPRYLSELIEQKQQELERQVALYRQGKSFPNVKHSSVIVVDDGLATGMTGRAACMAIKKLEPLVLIYASPVCAPKSIESLKPVTDSIICVYEPRHFSSVGQFYSSFPQIKDGEVLKLIDQAA